MSDILRLLIQVLVSWTLLFILRHPQTYSSVRVTYMQDDIDLHSHILSSIKLSF